MPLSDKDGPAGADTPRGPANTTEVLTAMTIPPDVAPFTGAHHDQDHPHACLAGYVYLGYTALDEETGEEVERVEALPCRRCADSR